MSIELSQRVKALSLKVDDLVKQVEEITARLEVAESSYNEDSLSPDMPRRRGRRPKYENE